MSKPFKRPNLKAPRKRKESIDFLSYPNRDRYGFFAQMKADHPDLQQFTNKEIAGWLKAYLGLLAEEVLNNREGVRLPGSLGAVVLGLTKPTEKTAAYNIDFVKSAQLGVLVSHRNSNTDGYLAKIYYHSNILWDRLEFHHHLRFEPCRKLTRAVAAVMKNKAEYKKYIVFTKKSPVSALFNNYRTRKCVKRKLKT